MQIVEIVDLGVVALLLAQVLGSFTSWQSGFGTFHMQRIEKPILFQQWHQLFHDLVIDQPGLIPCAGTVQMLHTIAALQFGQVTATLW